MGAQGSRVAFTAHSTTDDYDLDELKEEAWHIMVQRKACSRITDSHI
jgi:hypothetical protein